MSKLQLGLELCPRLTKTGSLGLSYIDLPGEPGGIPGNTRFGVTLEDGGIWLSCPQIEGGRPVRAEGLSADRALEALSGQSMESGRVAGEFYVAWSGSRTWWTLVSAEGPIGKDLEVDFMYRSFLKTSGRRGTKGTLRYVPGRYYHTRSRKILYLGEVTGRDKAVRHAFVYGSEIQDGTKRLSEVIDRSWCVVEHRRISQELTSPEVPTGRVAIRVSESSSILVELTESVEMDLGPDQWPSRTIDQVLLRAIDKKTGPLSYRRYGELVLASKLLSGGQYKGSGKDVLLNDLVERAFKYILAFCPKSLHGDLSSRVEVITDILERFVSSSTSYRKQGPKYMPSHERWNILGETFGLSYGGDLKNNVIDRILRINFDDLGFATKVLWWAMEDGVPYLELRRAQVSVLVGNTGEARVKGEETSVDQLVSTFLPALTKTDEWKSKVRELRRSPKKNTRAKVSSTWIVGKYPELLGEIWNLKVYEFTIDLVKTTTVI